MPTPTGHGTDLLQSFGAPTPQELQKRASLQAQIAALSSPFPDLLSDRERHLIRAGVQRVLYIQKVMGWQQGQGSIRRLDAQSKPPPGVSMTYRAGTSPPAAKRTVGRPRIAWVPSVSSEVLEFLGASHFDHWRTEGANARFCGKAPADMNRDELLAVIGWAMRSRDVWRLGLERRVDPSLKRLGAFRSVIPKEKPSLRTEPRKPHEGSSRATERGSAVIKTKLSADGRVC